MGYYPPSKKSISQVEAMSPCYGPLTDFLGLSNVEVEPAMNRAGK